MVKNQNLKSQKSYGEKFNIKELRNIILQNDLIIKAKITPFIRADICSHFPSRPNYILNYNYSEQNSKFKNNNPPLNKRLSECDTLFIRKIRKEIKNNQKYFQTNKNNNKKKERAQNILTAHLIYAKKLSECNIINKSNEKIIEKINFDKNIKQFFKINPKIINFYLNQKCTTSLLNYYCSENIVQTKLVSNNYLITKNTDKFSESSIFSYDLSNKSIDNFEFSWDILNSIVPNIVDMSVSVSFTISLDFTNSSIFSLVSSDRNTKNSVETNLAISYTNLMMEYCSDQYARTASGTLRRQFPMDKFKFPYRYFGCLDGIVKTKKVTTKEISKERSRTSECLALSHMFSLRKLLGRKVSKCNEISSYIPFKPNESESDTLKNSSLESVDSYDKALSKKFEKLS